MPAAEEAHSLCCMFLAFAVGCRSLSQLLPQPLPHARFFTLHLPFFLTPGPDQCCLSLLACIQRNSAMAGSRRPMPAALCINLPTPWQGIAGLLFVCFAVVLPSLSSPQRSMITCSTPKLLAAVGRSRGLQRQSVSESGCRSACWRVVMRQDVQCVAVRGCERAVSRLGRLEPPVCLQAVLQDLNHHSLAVDVQACLVASCWCFSLVLFCWQSFEVLFRGGDAACCFGVEPASPADCRPLVLGCDEATFHGL